LTYFILAIIAGVAIGLAFGWFVRPAPVRSASPQNLRADYKTDYVLMVAEAYTGEGNVANAAERLHFLGNEQVIVYVRESILYAGQHDYSQVDVDTMNALAVALGSWIPQPGGGTQ
jgi:hypothetical protein